MVGPYSSFYKNRVYQQNFIRVITIALEIIATLRCRLIMTVFTFLSCYVMKNENFLVSCGYHEWLNCSDKVWRTNAFKWFIWSWLLRNVGKVLSDRKFIFVQGFHSQKWVLSVQVLLKLRVATSLQMESCLLLEVMTKKWVSGMQNVHILYLRVINYKC